jgi:probable O-glycosylation ligase (exosortase A-associated)
MTDHQTIVILGALIMGALAVAGLLRPFFGLLVLITIYYVQPAELIPALEPLHIERTYAIALLLAFLLQRPSNSERPVLNPILRAGMALVGVAALSVPFAVWRGGAVEATVNLAKLIIYLFLLSTLIDTKDRMRKVLWLLAGLLAWISGNGFLSYLQGNFIVRQGIDRAVGETSIVGDPNALASTISGLLPLVFVLWRCSQKILQRLLLLGLMLLALATMVVTGSRTGLIGLAVIVLYYVFNSRHKVAALALCAVVAIVLWLAMPRQYQERYLTTVHFAQGEKLDDSNELRVHLWKAGWRMFLDHPILGVGAGQFSTAYGTFYSGAKHGAWMSPHSLFFQVAAELGLVGLVAFGSFLFRVVRANLFVLKAHAGDQQGWDYQLALALGAALLGYAVVSVTGHTFFSPRWYFTAGLIAANFWLTQTSLASTTAVAGSEDLGIESRGDEPELVWGEDFVKGRG